jgi:excinuclease ABC subunit A
LAASAQQPATYRHVQSHPRSLRAPASGGAVRGYEAGRFSFNVKGAVAENARATASENQDALLPPVYVTCEACSRRYNRETLEVQLQGPERRGRSDMTVDEAVTFFRAVPQIYEPLHARRGRARPHSARPIGDDAGGEAQRVKLAAELSRKATGRTLCILDEPTTGLHFHDVAKLLESLLLRASGNTLLVIEQTLMSSRQRIDY